MACCRYHGSRRRVSMVGGERRAVVAAGLHQYMRTPVQRYAQRTNDVKRHGEFTRRRAAKRETGGVVRQHTEVKAKPRMKRRRTTAA